MFVARCSDCRNNGRPLLVRNSCVDCHKDFINRHRTVFPGHVVESSMFEPDMYEQQPSRATSRLTRRVSGW